MTSIVISYWKDKLIIPNYARTTEGLEITIPPVDIIDAKDKESLITIIRARINNKEIIVPHPKGNGWKNVLNLCSQAVGYKSPRRLDKETKLQVGIGIRENSVVMIRYHKPIKGFEWLANREDERTINSKDPEVLAKYIMEEVRKYEVGE